MNIKVSVVIPVYKAEKYLDECINSVVLQDYQDLEIILVDDGSPDECPVLCDEYAQKYENIKVVHQANKGAAEARNTGIENALGEYIFFLDSDDLIDGSSVISNMVKVALEENADLVVGSYRRLTSAKISEVNYHHLQGGEYTKSARFRFDGFYRYGHLAYNCGKLYRKDFLLENKLSFPSYSIAEDKASNIRCYACGARYSFVNHSVFLYRENFESTTFRYIHGLSDAWIAIAEEFICFIDERNLSSEYYDLAFFHVFFGSFFLAKQELQAKKKLHETVRALKEYCKRPFVKKSMNALAKGKYLKGIESISWKFMIWGSSLLFSLHGYFPMACGIALLRKMEVDSKITKSRYKKEQQK